MAILADGIGSMHGVTRTIEEIRQRGVPGFEIEVVGTDPEVDRRLSAVAEIDVPYYPGLRIGVPSLPAAVQTLSDGAFDAIHVCSPGPAGIAGALVARALSLPLVGSYHTELTAYAGLRSDEPRVADAMALAVSAFYNACDIVLSPSLASDAALAGIGMPVERILRWDRGVDTSRFDPSLRDRVVCCPRELSTCSTPGASPARRAPTCSPTLSCWRASAIPACISCSPAAAPSTSPCASASATRATFLGWLEGTELARAYACADLFLFPSATDTFGQVILEAQASGLPVIAVAAGGPLSLIEDRVTGLLREARRPRPGRSAVLELADSPLLRERLAARGPRRGQGAAPGSGRLQRLAEGYRRVLLPATADISARAA